MQPRKCLHKKSVIGLSKSQNLFLMLGIDFDNFEFMSVFGSNIELYETETLCIFFSGWDIDAYIAAQKEKDNKVNYLRGLNTENT